MPLGENHLWAGVYSNPDTYYFCTRGPKNESCNRNERSMNFDFENAHFKRKHKYVNEQT